MANTRIEKDSMGELEVPASALYGAQTQRAVNNFPISGLPVPRAFIEALGLIKYTAAEVNLDLGLLPSDVAKAIMEAASAVAAGDYDEHFPIDIFQTGSGTSSNMNANEVISHVAAKAGIKVHPNDHVNRGQSSNDVIPTAIHVSTAIQMHNHFRPAITHLVDILKTKIKEVGHITKTGRTHLMDAMPLTFAQEMGGWVAQLEANMERLAPIKPHICALAQGGTAVGTGINAHPDFGKKFAQALAKSQGIPFSVDGNYFEKISSQDAVVSLSGQLAAVATTLMKIANDCRWMGSGPLAGLGEITLPSLQPGSSIMPGKVNPVVPEAMTMVCAQVMGNNNTIIIAGQAGNFQLSVMLPVIAYNILQSIEILSNCMRVFADQVIKDFTVNEEHIEAQLSKNPILITALNAVIGYEKGAAIAKKSYQEKRPVIEVAKEMTDLSEEELKRLLAPEQLTKGGIPS